MAKTYTLEDVETLRSKAGVSYEEAVALLDKYNGDTARALIELEKRGRLDNAPQGHKVNFDEILEQLKQLWNKGLTTRIRVERKGETLINLSVLFLLLMLLLGAYAVLAAVILGLVCGCSVHIQTPDKNDVPVYEDVPETQPAEEKSNDDDDFPSITIS